MKISEKQLEICKQMNWIVETDSEGNTDLINWSPAGENILFHIEKEKDFAIGIKELASDFDADEHAEMLVEGRGKNGVPSSIRVLIDDADAIEEMLWNLADALEEAEEKENG